MFMAKVRRFKNKQLLITNETEHALCEPGQKLNTSQDLGVKVAAPVGTLVGQLLFGWLADVVGRKRMCE
jgi:hypothetical protein